MERLNIGCGLDVRDGWTNADRAPVDARVLAADPLDGLPWEDDYFGLVVANHVLQMVAWPDLVPWLTEVRRVIEPGGVLRLIVPDMIGAVRAYARGQIEWFPIADEHEASIDGKLCMYLAQAGSTRSVFTEPWLRELFHRAGWAKAYLAAPRVTIAGAELDGICELDSRFGESLIMEGVA